MTTLIDPPHELDTNEQVRPPRRQRPRVTRWILFGAMIVIAVVMLYPFWVMIFTSLKSEAQFLSGSGFSWLSWKDLSSTIPVGQEVLSSTIVCSASILIILLVGTSRGLRLLQVALSAPRPSSFSSS